MAIQYRTITLSSNVDAHATGDVVAAPEEIVNFARVLGGAAMLDTVVLVDEDDNSAALDLVFLNASGSIGTESATFTMTDAVALTHLGTVNVLAADYDDNVDNKTATVTNLGLIMGCAPTTTSVWMGIVARDSIDLAAVDDITVKLGIIWD